MQTELALTIASKDAEYYTLGEGMEKEKKSAFPDIAKCMLDQGVDQQLLNSQIYQSKRSIPFDQGKAYKAAKEGFVHLSKTITKKFKMKMKFFKIKDS